MKKIIIVLGIIWLAVFAHYAYTTDLNTSRLLQSSQGCCTIFYEDMDVTSDDVLVYYVRYTTHDGEVQDTHVQEPELESTINMYQEYCYAHHN